jgi:parallel beta-helix repeat protein
MKHTALFCTTIGALALLGSAALLTAGPLNPPSGAVAPTYKTLTDVEPRTAVSTANTPGDADSRFKITQPGSYYLTGNITAVAGKHGIEITSGGVTLDLNGFDLAGIPGMGAFDGVNVSVDSLRDIAVINGSVRNWGDEGVDLGFLSFGCRVEGVRASGNAGIGINGGVACTITNCTADFNAQTGLRTNNGATISNCSVYSNTIAGMQVNQGCTISACSAYFNTGPGILAGGGCTVVDCSTYQNTGSGIQLGEAGSATRCTSYGNDVAGIRIGNGCTVADCTASFNDSDGIAGTDDITISGCTTRSNGGYGIYCVVGAMVTTSMSTSNGESGILVSRGAVTGCNASSNARDGIFAFYASVVTDCTASDNTNNGIACNSDSAIRGNTCRSNGTGADGAGIVVFGEDCRIEGNTSTDADRGIDVRAAGNIIIRNTCSGNTTDWVLVGGNSLGPILDRRFPGLPGVNGFSAPSSLNTTDPHANFSY